MDNIVDESEQNGDESHLDELIQFPSTWMLPEEFVVCFWANVGPRDEFTGCREWRGQYDQRTGRPVMRFEGIEYCAVSIAITDAGISEVRNMVAVPCPNKRCVDTHHVRLMVRE